MKIKNTHTGEIVEWECGPLLGKEYSSIDELAEDWEDVNEVTLPDDVKGLLGTWLVAQPFEVSRIEGVSDRTPDGAINYFTAIPKGWGWDSVDLDICTPAPLFPMDLDIGERNTYTLEELGLEL